MDRKKVGKWMGVSFCFDCDTASLEMLNVNSSFFLSLLIAALKDYPSNHVDQAKNRWVMPEAVFRFANVLIAVMGYIA